MGRTRGVLYVAYEPESEEVRVLLFIALESLVESVRFRDAFHAVEVAFRKVARERSLRTTSHGLVDPHDLPSNLKQLDLREVPRADIEDFIDTQTMEIRQRAVEQLERCLRSGKPYVRPRLTVGAIARDVNFYDRENAIKEVSEALKSGHVLLVAPRRFGKSSLLYALFDNPPDSWKAVLTDVEAAATPAEFVAKIVIALRKAQWLSEFPQILDSIGGALTDTAYQKAQDAQESMAEEHANDWPEYLKTAFSSLKADNVPLLLLIDEFPWLVEHLIEQKKDTEARQLIGVLNLVAAANVPYRILLAGSANMDFLLHQFGEESATSFNRAFCPVQLPPMPTSAARELVRIVLADNDLYPDAEALEAVLDCIGKPIPFFLQLLASRIVEDTQRPAGKEPTAEDVRRVYETDLLGPESKRLFEPYGRAIKCYSDNLQPAAREVLAHLTRGDATRSDLEAVVRQAYPPATDEDIRRLLGYLENDLYIARNGQDRFEFSSKVLRDWWQRHGRLEVME